MSESCLHFIQVPRVQIHDKIVFKNVRIIKFSINFSTLFFLVTSAHKIPIFYKQLYLYKLGPKFKILLPDYQTQTSNFLFMLFVLEKKNSHIQRQRTLSIIWIVLFLWEDNLHKGNLTKNVWRSQY